ncbi:MULTISPECIES: winged helix-turn-helix transcriptional regulator [unclassified Streptomyces]|uniref:winged helix-turn-helix transcriptional regulator n=1 Tax=unclassified Streptomyces TaxID=2593676 RepID=UPI002251DB39|nr:MULTISPECIES: helix-turn-helix domain-containing protein [unclassified Streptomyces]MCX4632564.1 helix-turn-helix transcriptional regulator [Streptomyces sp. NBC_01443]WSW49225.1 helix-turn-helix transcriptional regulator [Streptomyces sp. NBC_01001]
MSPGCRAGRPAELEYNGLVDRRRYAEVPPRVDYTLTEAGRALLVPIRAMGTWAARYADTVVASQDRFDTR